MNSRFLTIWATVSVAGSVLSMGAKDPLSAAIAWAVIGFTAALIDAKLPDKQR